MFAQVVTCCPLDAMHDLIRGNCWWKTSKQVHVIWHNFAANDLNLSRFAKLLVESLDPFVDGRDQYWFAIFT